MTLEQMRRSKGVKKKDLMKLLGISYPTYRKLENDPGLLTVEQAQTICDYLGCTLDDIFFA